MDEPKETIELSDVNLIAFLFTLKIRPLGNKVKFEHIYFEYPDTPDLQEARRQFYASEAITEVQTYADALRRTKLQVRELQREAQRKGGRL